MFTNFEGKRYVVLIREEKRLKGALLINFKGWKGSMSCRENGETLIWYIYVL